MTRTTLVIGGSAAAREAAIAHLLPAAAANDGPVAIIVEGMADGIDRIGAAFAASLAAPHTEAAPPAPHLVRIAAACPCCVGNLVLRVTLNRLLRPPPAALYLALASTEHLAQVKQFLTQAPYDAILQLQPDIDLSSAPSSLGQSPL